MFLGAWSQIQHHRNQIPSSQNVFVAVAETFCLWNKSSNDLGCDGSSTTFLMNSQNLESIRVWIAATWTTISQLAHQHRICRDISGCLTSKFEQHQNQIQVCKQCLCSSRRDILFVQSSFKDLGCDGSYTTTFLKNSQINQSWHCSNLTVSQRTHQHRICTDISGYYWPPIPTALESDPRVCKKCLCSSCRDTPFVQWSFKDLACDRSSNWSHSKPWNPKSIQVCLAAI